MKDKIQQLECTDITAHQIYIYLYSKSSFTGGVLGCCSTHWSPGQQVYYFAKMLWILRCFTAMKIPAIDPHKRLSALVITVCMKFKQQSYYEVTTHSSKRKPLCWVETKCFVCECEECEAIWCIHACCTCRDIHSLFIYSWSFLFSCMSLACFLINSTKAALNKAGVCCMNRLSHMYRREINIRVWTCSLETVSG